MTDAERAALERKISEMRTPFNVPFDNRAGNWILTETGPDKYDAAPRPWTSDESANAVLLEEIAVPEYCCVEVKWDGWSKKWEVIIRKASLDESDEHAPLFPVYSYDDRKIAVALAWVAWKEGR